MTPKALIFDVDGTLAETEELHRRAFNETFAHFNLDWRWTQDDYRVLLRVAGGKERIRHFMDRGGATYPAFDDAQIAELHAFKTTRYVALLSAGSFELRPGIRRLIADAIDRGIQLGIATTTSRDNVNCLLEGAFGPSALSMFGAIVCGEDVQQKKPSPEVYLRALQMLALPPADGVAFEDSRNGLLAARLAGLRVAITPAFYTDHEDFSGAEWIFNGDEPSLAALS